MRHRESAFYEKQRDCGLDHDAARRAPSNRLAGILRGCLKTGTRYDEATACFLLQQKAGASFLRVR